MRRSKLSVIKGSSAPGRRRRRKLHKEELYNLYCSTQYCPSDEIDKNVMVGHVAHMGDQRCIKVLEEKDE